MIDKTKKDKATFKTTDLMLGRVTNTMDLRPSTIRQNVADSILENESHKNANENLETDRNALETGRAMITNEVG